jgi:UDP-N-acetylglucosamine 4-epimerase
VGDRTTLKELQALIQEKLARLTGKRFPEPSFAPFRAGDVRHSLADVAKARRLLGYAPTHDVSQGLDEALAWYVESLARA